MLFLLKGSLGRFLIPAYNNNDNIIVKVFNLLNSAKSFWWWRCWVRCIGISIKIMDKVWLNSNCSLRENISRLYSSKELLSWSVEWSIPRELGKKCNAQRRFHEVSKETLMCRFGNKAMSKWSITHDSVEFISEEIKEFMKQLEEVNPKFEGFYAIINRVWQDVSSCRIKYIE
jgi:hypothetical protein